MEDNTTKTIALETKETQCIDCMTHSVTVRFLEASERGYDLAGTVLCSHCGAAMEAIVNHIPIEFKDLACPECRQQRLRVEPAVIQEVSPGVYAFRLTYTCLNKVCSFRRALESILPSLWNKVKKVEASLTGISITTKD